MSINTVFFVADPKAGDSLLDYEFQTRGSFWECGGVMEADLWSLLDRLKEAFPDTEFGEGFISESPSVPEEEAEPSERVWGFLPPVMETLAAASAPQIEALATALRKPKIEEHRRQHKSKAAAAHHWPAKCGNDCLQAHVPAAEWYLEFLTELQALCAKAANESHAVFMHYIL